jgi:hypothetical protein
MSCNTEENSPGRLTGVYFQTEMTATRKDGEDGTVLFVFGKDEKAVAALTPVTPKKIPGIPVGPSEPQNTKYMAVCLKHAPRQSLCREEAFLTVPEDWEWVVKAPGLPVEEAAEAVAEFLWKTEKGGNPGADRKAPQQAEQKKPEGSVRDGVTTFIDITQDSELYMDVDCVAQYIDEDPRIWKYSLYLEKETLRIRYSQVIAVSEDDSGSFRAAPEVPADIAARLSENAVRAVLTRMLPELLGKNTPGELGIR